MNKNNVLDKDFFEKQFLKMVSNTLTMASIKKARPMSVVDASLVMLQIKQCPEYEDMKKGTEFVNDAEKMYAILLDKKEKMESREKASKILRRLSELILSMSGFAKNISCH